MTYLDYLDALDLAKNRIENARAMSDWEKKEATEHLEAALEHCHDALGALTEPFDPEPGEEGAA